MATVYADASGNIIQFLRDFNMEQGRSAPNGTALTVTFDERTNLSVVSALDTGIATHSVSGSTLLRNGNPVSIASAGLAYTDRQTIATLWTTLKSDQSPTTAQLRVLLRYILRHIYLDE